MMQKRTGISAGLAGCLAMVLLFAACVSDRGSSKLDDQSIALATQNIAQSQSMPATQAANYYIRGMAYVQKGAWESALIDFDHAVRLRPDYDLVYKKRSQVHQLPEATADLVKYLELNPEDGEAKARLQRLAGTKAATAPAKAQVSVQGPGAAGNDGIKDLEAKLAGQKKLEAEKLAQQRAREQEEAKKQAALALAAMKDKPKLSPTGAVHGLKPRLFVLSVGVSVYKNSGQNLEYAAADARALAEALKEQPTQVFREIKTEVLLDQKATRSSILTAMGSFLGQAASSDVILIFLAGHGVKKEDTGSYFFLPHLATPHNLLDQGLSWYGFEEAVKTLQKRVKNIIVMLDTCHSGAMKIAMRGVQSGQDLSQAFASEGFYSLAAAHPDEGAAETSNLMHGVFTYAILEGLRRQADLNGDKIIDTIELFHYVEYRVAELTNGLQHPHFYMGGGSLPLGVVE
jgi:tetratricopeptide (TPR) repeat protein